MERTKKVEEMNLPEKLLKIAGFAGVLQKNKQGYNYKYVTEDEIQAKITVAMQKYHVMLLPSIIQNSLNVTPITYQKFDKKKGEMVTVNEVIVACEVTYTWTNTDNPSEHIDCNWAYIGQMEDASQAFGAGATYGNRYYLLKALQLATTDDDPDAYRSKQKKAEDEEIKQAEKKEKEALNAVIQEIIKLGQELIANGMPNEKIVATVAQYNNSNGNPKSIKTIDVAQEVLNAINELKGE